MKRGQSDIVGFLIITLIILTVVSGTFFWAKGMIEQNNDFNDVSRMENRMREIHRAIKEVANDQGQRSLDVEIKKGYLFLENNYTLTYSADMDLPAAKSSGDSVLIGNGTSGGVCLGSMYGTIGVDDAGCMIENGEINIKLKYITLNETSTGSCYNIFLQSGGSASAGEGMHNVLIRYVSSDVDRADIPSNCSQMVTKVIEIDIE